MDKSKQPGISFDSIMLVKESFWRDYVVPENSKLDFQIGMGWNHEDGEYFVELDTILTLIYEEKEVLKLESTFVGVFSLIEERQNMDIQEYIKNYSPGLMFPYIREHISNITQKSGSKPILLPPINVIALINQSEKGS